MKPAGLLRTAALLAIFGAFALAVSLPAHAGTITWADWSGGPTTPGTPGVAWGTLSGTAVKYTGQFDSIVTSWSFDQSPFAGSPATPYGPYSGPPASSGIIQIVGGSGISESIIFSSPVVNPIIAIWSLGQPGDTASFDFTTSDFSIIAGGPDGYGGGSSIYVDSSNADNVDGTEGSGLVEFSGIYTEIDFTTPVNENWYGLTVGEEATPPPVPEPETLSLLGLGVAMLPFLRSSLARRRRA